MTAPTAQQFLTTMRSYLGIVESPSGSNRTVLGEKFGWNGVPWCAITLSVACEESGWGRTFWSASTDQWESEARSGEDGARWLVNSINPAPGDILVWDWKRDGTANHVSALESLRDDGMFITIGGNESNRVQRAVRSRSGLRGFIRLPFKVSVPPKKSVEKGDQMVKIEWFKGDPTAPGDQKDVEAAYAVTYDETPFGRKVAVAAHWIPDLEVLNNMRWAYGGVENQTRRVPKSFRDHGCQFFGGPFRTR